MLVRHCEFCSQHRSEPLLFMLINDSVKDGSFDLGGGGGGGGENGFYVHSFFWSFFHKNFFLLSRAPS